MRTIKHWSPTYLFHRSIERIYRWSHPEVPWLTPQVNEILASWMRDSDSGLEFGSGRSTIWFARRCGKITSVEHNPEWYKAVSQKITANGLDNVTYQLYPGKDDLDSRNSPYVQAAEQFDANELDFVLVDGIYRDACVLAVLEKICPGGILILDNVHLYFPSESHSPNAVMVGEPPASELWREALEELGNWRWFWTSNQVSDTAIFVKPAS